MKKIVSFILCFSLSLPVQTMQEQAKIEKKIKVIAGIISKKIQQGDTDSTAKLLKRYADIIDNNILFLIAAEQSDLDLFNYLMNLPEQERPNVNYAEASQGYTPLILASSKGHTDLVTRLLDIYRATIDTRDNKGYSALMHAIAQDHLGTVNALLNRKALTRQVANDGKTALFLAVKKGFPLIVRSLLQSDPKLVHIKNSEGSTP